MLVRLGEFIDLLAISRILFCIEITASVYGRGLVRICSIDEPAVSIQNGKTKL